MYDKIDRLQIESLVKIAIKNRKNSTDDKPVEELIKKIRDEWNEKK